MRLWRLVREPYVDQAFSGYGASVAGGRWNVPGEAMAYASQHLSLAALEVFVHLDVDIEPNDLVAVEAEFPLEPRRVAAMEASIRSLLPLDWREDRPLTRRLGHEFLSAGLSAAMLVPSVVVDVEWNILLNPGHADFAKLRILSTRPFRFDPRMFHR